MKNLKLIKWIPFFMLSLVIRSPVYAEVEQLVATEKKVEAIKIEKPIEPTQMAPPLKTEVVIPEKPEKTWAIPKRITRTIVAPSERRELDQLELDYSSGKITQTQYDLRKDFIARESIINF